MSKLPSPWSCHWSTRHGYLTPVFKCGPHFFHDHIIPTQISKIKSRKCALIPLDTIFQASALSRVGGDTILPRLVILLSEFRLCKGFPFPRLSAPNWSEWWIRKSQIIESSFCNGLARRIPICIPPSRPILVRSVLLDTILPRLEYTRIDDGWMMDRLDHTKAATSPWYLHNGFSKIWRTRRFQSLNLGYDAPRFNCRIWHTNNQFLIQWTRRTMWLAHKFVKERSIL